MHKTQNGACIYIENRIMGTHQSKQQTSLLLFRLMFDRIDLLPCKFLHLTLEKNFHSLYNIMYVKYEKMFKRGIVINSVCLESWR